MKDLGKIIRGQGGFTLVEIAIVLVILGLIIGGLLVPFGQLQESTRRSDTKTQLTEVKNALYGFAQTHGRLPCPATPASAGREAPAGGGSCDLRHGFIPAITLGLKGSFDANGRLLDAWNNPLRYSVDPYFTTTTGTPNIKTQFANRELGAMVIRLAEAPPTPPAVNAPAVVLSMGKNWANFTSPPETANSKHPTFTDDTFYSIPYSEERFDDMISWLSPFLLYHKMIQAGQLP